MKFNFQVVQTLEDLKRLLDTGIQRLRLDDNCINFIVTATIPAGTDYQIPNKLKIIPSKRLIIRQQGNGLVTDAAVTWTKDTLYLRNHGPDDTTVTILFME